MPHFFFYTCLYPSSSIFLISTSRHFSIHYTLYTTTYFPSHVLAAAPDMPSSPRYFTYLLYFIQYALLNLYNPPAFYLFKYLYILYSYFPCFFASTHKIPLFNIPTSLPFLSFPTLKFHKLLVLAAAPDIIIFLFYYFLDIFLFSISYYLFHSLSITTSINFQII